VGAYVLSKIPDLVDAGMRGYFWSQMEGFDFSNPEDMGGIFGSLSVTNTNDTKIFERALAPIAAEAKRRFGADKVKFTIRTQAYPTFLSYMEQGSDRDPVGFNKYVDSWLLSADALRSESPEMYEANKCMATRGYAQSLRVLLVSGKGVHEADSEGTTSVNPFWRKNYAVIGMRTMIIPVENVVLTRHFLYQPWSRASSRSMRLRVSLPSRPWPDAWVPFALWSPPPADTSMRQPVINPTGSLPFGATATRVFWTSRRRLTPTMCFGARPV
jgi:hypothetical protein